MRNFNATSNLRLAQIMLIECTNRTDAEASGNGTSVADQ
jgi:hypothetical protein